MQIKKRSELKMATVNQVYAIVNSSAKQALGGEAVSVTDTGSLVSLGDQILSSDTNKEAFYNALTDRIGLTIVAIRDYKAKYRSVYRNGMDWGAVFQKISYSLSTGVENPSWIGDAQASPFDVEGTVKAKQKLFSKLSTWSNEEKIPDYQLRTAFTNASAMSAFIDGIYISMKNSMELEIERVSALAVNTNIAGCLLKGVANMKRDLLFEYNLAEGSVTELNVVVDGKTPLTMEKALKDAEFLKYASKEINNSLYNISSYSQVFNAEGTPRHTSKEKAVLEVLNEFASASDVYLQSNTYHKELTALPNYERVPYWQGSGNSFTFKDCSTVSISNASLAVDDNVAGEITQSGVIAFLHDIDSCASTMYDRRTTSMYNPRSEVNVYMEKATVGYAVDLSENAIVFYMTDPKPSE